MYLVYMQGAVEESQATRIGRNRRTNDQKSKDRCHGDCYSEKGKFTQLFIIYCKCLLIFFPEHSGCSCNVYIISKFYASHKDVQHASLCVQTHLICYIVSKVTFVE